MRTIKVLVLMLGVLALLGSACSAEVETASEESPAPQQEQAPDEEDSQAADVGVTVSGGPECDELRNAEVSVSPDGVVIGSGDNQVVVDRNGVTVEGEGGAECRIDTSEVQADDADTSAGSGESVEITSDQEFTCNGHDVNVSSDETDVLLTGSCGVVTVSGVQSNVFVMGSAHEVAIPGDQNDVAVNSASQVTVSGNQNDFCVNDGPVTVSGSQNTELDCAEYGL